MNRACSGAKKFAVNFVDRRKFLQMVGASTSLLLAERSACAVALATQPSDSGHGIPLKEFSYADVSLGAGPHQVQLTQTYKALMGLDEDSLLRPYRIAANLPAPGVDLGGWYNWPRTMGETFGQWISALSRNYAINPEEATLRKVQHLVAEYGKTIERTGKIFRVNGNPVYFHDKLVQGLTDAAVLCHDSEALATLSRLMDTSQFVLAKKMSDELYEKVKEGSENYNFAETYFNAWAVSNDSRYFDLGKSDLNDGFIEPLANGHNELGGRHAYSHTNGLCGAAKAYLVLGDEMYLMAAINGLAFAERQSFATGGYGPQERFLPKPAIDIKSEETGETVHFQARVTPADSILLDKHHFETGCGSYAHFKLTRYLIRITKNSVYGDSMERVMYNAALGALPINKFGKAFYQSNYNGRARKEYFNGYDNVIEDEWPCCSGTLPQLATDYGISTYFHDEHGVFVNLYVPSTVNWSQSGTKVRLQQFGDYPLRESVFFKLEMAKSAAFTIRFRIPAWAQGPSLRINNSNVSERVKPGAFAEVRRRWRDGDQIELILPNCIELKAADNNHPDLVAVCCGPLVLFAIGDELPPLSRQNLMATRQLAPGAAEWRSGGVTFLPWWIIKDEVYTTYHDVGAVTSESKQPDT